MGGTAVSTKVASVSGDSARAQNIKARREALGMRIGDLAREADVDRGQLGEYEAGKYQASEPWIKRLENALKRIEYETGMDEPASTTEQPRMIRVTIEGVYGAKAVTFEGFPEDEDRIVSMVKRVLHGSEDGGEGDESHPTE